MKIVIALTLIGLLCFSGVASSQEVEIDIGKCVQLGMRYAVIADHSYLQPDDNKEIFKKYISDMEKINPPEMKDSIEAFAKLAWENRNISSLNGGMHLFEVCMRSLMESQSKHAEPKIWK